MGFYTSWHSECPRPRWGFHFLNKKTSDPGGVLHFPTLWKSETPVGILFFGQKNIIPRWGFALPDTLNARDPGGDSIFWIKKRQTPVGFCSSWHSECPRPRWGFYFLDKKTSDPGGVLHFQTPWKSKLHPVSSNFLTKKRKLHPVVCYLGHSGSQNYTLYLLFFSKKRKLHPVVCYIGHPESANHTLYLLIF